MELTKNESGIIDELLQGIDHRSGNIGQTEKAVRIKRLFIPFFYNHAKNMKIIACILLL
jgi:hypothetical protein